MEQCFYCLKYTQNQQDFFSTVMDVKTVINISKALIYGIDEMGYQRKLNEKHYNKIAKSIINKELISPTSIVLGVDEPEFMDKIVKLDTEDIYKLIIDDKKQIFRIIDGQHRLKGLQKAIEKNEAHPDLHNYQLNVIIMMIKKNKRIEEVKVFNNINSKAKPVKTDLTMLALSEYEILESEHLDESFDKAKHIAIKTAYKLNESKKSLSIWENAIKLDPNADNSMGIIGFKTFFDSIKDICKMYNSNFKNNMSKNAIIYEIDKISDEITNELIIPCWEFVHDKWEDCFKEQIMIYNFEEIKYYYNKKYYIQKSMGVKSINGVISDLFKEKDGNIQDTIDEFKMYVKKSDFTAKDWRVGGRLLGLNSEAGVKKIKSILVKR